MRLEVFGSAVGDSFDPDKSDLDFLVEFQIGANLGPSMANYFDLKEQLENSLGCKVDLVMQSALKNPYFIKEVNRSKRLLYEAEIAQMA
ncbi:MAG: nucleotidyltransferase domain-containing protein [Syntrophaceae bacterium]|nr:nucleotidyltransferase domain-containing protein [Syntrophaceae bacterium]